MEKKSRYPNDVMFSALSWLLFFWLVVQASLKKTTNERTEDERNFVDSWCNVWNGMLWLLALFFINIILANVANRWLFSFFSEFFGFLILTLVIIFLPMIISWFHFRIFSLVQTESEEKTMLTAFIPLYSSYQRFSKKDQLDETSRWWLKEAQLWLLFIWLALFCFNSYMIGVIFAWLMVLRIILALVGKDIFSPEQKERIRHRFSTYPEEFFSAILIFIKEGFVLATWKQEIAVEEMVNYQQSYKKNRWIWTRILSILFLGSLWFLGRYRWNSGKYRKAIPLIWILMRYLIFLWTKTKIPKFPIIAEITA